MPEGSKKKIVGFICQWCTSGASENFGCLKKPDLPVNVDLIRLPCTGNIDPAYIIRALLQGAEGIFTSGCHPGDCHYVEGNYRARRRFAMLKALFEHFDLSPNSFSLNWIATSEIKKFSDTLWKISTEAELGDKAASDKPVAWRNI